MRVPWRFRLVLLSLAVTVSVLGLACDEERGVLTTYRNDSEISVVVFTDLLPQEFVDAEGRLIRPFQMYDHQMQRLRPGVQRKIIRSGVEMVAPETKYVVTAVTDDGQIAYQQVFTAAKLRDPDTVVVISETRSG